MQESDLPFVIFILRSYYGEWTLKRRGTAILAVSSLHRTPYGGAGSPCHILAGLRLGIWSNG